MRPRVTLIDTPVIETERLVLRAPRLEDFEPFAAFLGSERARYMGGPVERGRAWRAFCHVVAHWPLRGFGPFVIEREGRPIGSGGPWRPEDWPEVEIAYCLWDASQEGHGYVREAMLAARADAWSLGLTRLVSYIEPPNAASIRVAQRLGCTRDEAAHGPDAQDLVFRHPHPEAA
jgi:RimJ/RimL family protein N-acetyltransferase